MFANSPFKFPLHNVVIVCKISPCCDNLWHLPMWHVGRDNITTWNAFNAQPPDVLLDYIVSIQGLTKLGTIITERQWYVCNDYVVFLCNIDNTWNTMKYIWMLRLLRSSIKNSAFLFCKREIKYSMLFSLSCVN